MASLFSQALNANSDGFNGYTIVQRFAPAVLSLPSGNIAWMRATFEASTAEGFAVADTYVGHGPGADEFDWAATPTQMTWSGSAGVSIGAGATATTDWCPFRYNKTSDLMFAWFCSGADAPRFRSGLSADIERYFKSTGSSESSLVNKSSYDSLGSGILIMINSIEVLVGSRARRPKPLRVFNRRF